MKKIFPVFLLIFLIGCEKDYNNVVDIQVNSLQVSSVIAINSFNYNSADSLITVSLKFQSIVGLSSVNFNIYRPGNSKINSGPVELLDNGNLAVNGDSTKGDMQYSGKFPMSRYYENGIYTIRYFANLTDGSTKNVAEQNFTYYNNQSNVAPVISNVVISPDTVTATGPVIILTSATVSDQNSLNDIEKTYFIVFKPDGTTNNTQIEMFDDGNSITNGDQNAGDGIYSRKIQIDQNNDKGIYTLKFIVRDKGGLLSNEIAKTLVVK